MAIEWKVIHSKKKSVGRSVGCTYVVKHHRGDGWYGTRYRNQWSMEYPQTSHTVGPFKHKEDCITALETIDALCAPEKTQHQRYLEKMATFGSMYGTGFTTFIKGAKK